MTNDKDQKNTGRNDQENEAKKEREALNPFKDKSDVNQGRETPEDLAEEEQQFKEASTERD